MQLEVADGHCGDASLPLPPYRRHARLACQPRPLGVLVSSWVVARVFFGRGVVSSIWNCWKTAQVFFDHRIYAYFALSLFGFATVHILRNLLPVMLLEPRLRTFGHALVCYLLVSVYFKRRAHDHSASLCVPR